MTGIVTFHAERGMWQIRDSAGGYIAGDFARCPDALGYCQNVGIVGILDRYVDRVFPVAQYGRIHAYHAAHVYAEGPRMRKVQTMRDESGIVGYFVRGT
jgi:hypothetical protein